MGIYSVIFKSVTRATGSTTSDAFYEIDWLSILPKDTPFKVSFSFISATVNITSLTSVPQLLVGLGRNRAFRTIGPPTSYIGNTNVLGYLIPPALSTTTYLQADTNTNNPIFLDQRPMVNRVEVTITSAQTGAPWVDNVGASISSYDLVITFESLNEPQHMPLAPNF